MYERETYTGVDGIALALELPFYYVSAELSRTIV